jgi:transcriptional regulator with XRE-family HTH domain
MADTQSRHPVDRHVGARIRKRRRQLGISLKALGQSVGRSLQQVHAYESGANRVCASLLWEFATSLDVPVQYFFEGLAVPSRQRTPAEPRTTQPLRSYVG